MTQTMPPAPPGPSGGIPGPGRPEKEHVDFEYVRVRGDKGTLLSLVILLAVVGAFLLAVLYGVRWVRSQLDPPGEPGAEVVVDLGAGDTAATIGPLLEEEGIIPNSTVYSWYVRLKGGPSFQAGEYTFRRDSAVTDVLDVLDSGPTRVALAESVSITIPEGLTVEQIAERIDANPDLAFTGQQFVRELHRGRVKPRYGPEPGSLPPGAEEYEGLLFPDTYSLLRDSKPEDLIRQLIETFNQVATNEGIAQSEEKLGLTPYQVIIVASLIEEEAKVPEDRAKIARVIYNRLDAGMPLGIDATIVYDTGDNELTVTDLETESPYNTRLVVGLPPTPIAAPGAASIRAALNPARGEWLYYVLTSPDGTHSFSETYEQFLQDKAVCEDLGLCG